MLFLYNTEPNQYARSLKRCNDLKLISNFVDEIFPDLRMTPTYRIISDVIRNVYTLVSNFLAELWRGEKGDFESQTVR